MSINVENSAKTFLLHIDAATSENLERTYYEIDRWSDIVARQISKNQRFDSTGVLNGFNTLKDLCAKYDDQKDSVSNDIVIPAATEKWGKFANVAWSLNFSTATITVTFNGNIYQKRYNDIVEVPEDVNNELRDASIANAAFVEVYDKISVQYPTIDTDSYKEFMEAYGNTETAYKHKKGYVDRTFVTPYLNENDLQPERCQWSLHFSTRKIDLFETVDSEADAE